MNKSELIDSIAELSGLTKKDAERSLNATLESILKSLSKGGDVTIPNFGSFKVRLRSARKGRNPKTGEEIDIPEKKAIVFSPGKGLKDSVE